MKLNRKSFVLGVIGGLVFTAIAWAITVDEIWRSVYDSTNQALRINQVTP